MDNTIETQTIISYCTGTRGLERGLERVGIPMQTVAFLEIEAFIVGNLVAQMEAGLLDPAPIWTNIKTFDARPFRNKVHGIVGGYPCQPFSHAGERKGVEDERHLWPHIFGQIEIIRPEWVYFENVAGHLSLGYEQVRRSLSGLGYHVEEGIFTAEEVGAPHRRERLFVLGVMENASILGWRGRKSEDKVKGSSTCMADATIKRQQITRHAREQQFSEETGERLDNRFEQRGDTVVNTEIEIPRGLPIRTEPEQSGYQFTSTNMADTSSSRNEIRLSGSQQWEEGITREFDYSGDEHRFPAGQGIYQHEWEEPRTIESGLVYTIDGYNFTEDLHRAIGNSVVEQVAELAFISLLNKHFKNQNK